MSQENNLHSLLTSQWFIHEAYGRQLLPSLFAILDRQPLAVAPEPAAKKDPLPTLMGRNGVPAAAAAGKPGGAASEYVLVMDLKDPIYKYNQECGPRGTQYKMAILAHYKNDPACKGVVLDIDSGGGQVAGTPEFYDFLLDYGKPVVAYTNGYMCSAAYYIGSAASHIVANKRAEHIGSIGAMVHFIDVTGMYEAKGAKVITAYATKSTEKNRDFEELLAGKPENYIKNQLDPIVEDFHTDMKAVRSTLNEATLKGGTYNANDALKMGLVDEIGTLQTAVDKVFELAADQNSNNKNQNNMSKPRTLLHAVLGLNAPLVETAEKGTYFNAEQLDAIEAGYADKDTALTKAQSDLETANTAKTNAETALATAKADHTTATTNVTTQVDNMITAAGIEATGTLNEKLTALAGHYAEINKGDGAKPTTPRKGGASAEPTTKIYGVDISGLTNS